MKETPVVERIMALIDESPEINMPLSEIAKRAGISMYYMSHIFKKATSMTVIEYRTAKRIERAKEMLLHTPLTVTEIAFTCGFSSQGYFSERFTKVCGVSPTVYRSENKR